MKQMQKIGMGTFGSDRYDEEVVANAVYEAIKIGYRMFDCASVYGNEKQIGDVFKKAFDEGLVKREDLYIISKVWNDKHGEGKVIESCLQSVEDLGIGYIDLYFMHWPYPNYHAKGCDVTSRSADSKPFFVEDYMTAWRQMEELKERGVVKDIAMSNMTIPKFQAVLPLCRIMPKANEMELHPSFQQKELFDYCVSKGIQPIAYCPLGSPNRPDRDKEQDDVVDMQMPEIVSIAQKYGMHPAQVCLKWAIQRGQIPIPFASKSKNLLSNFSVVDSEPLSDEDMTAISAADKNCRLVKGHVFLWKGAKDWHDLWDEDGKLPAYEFKDGVWIKK